MIARTVVVFPHAVPTQQRNNATLRHIERHVKQYLDRSVAAAMFETFNIKRPRPRGRLPSHPHSSESLRRCPGQ